MSSTPSMFSSSLFSLSVPRSDASASADSILSSLDPDGPSSCETLSLARSVASVSSRFLLFFLLIGHGWAIYSFSFFKDIAEAASNHSHSYACKKYPLFVVTGSIATMEGVGAEGLPIKGNSTRRDMVAFSCTQNRAQSFVYNAYPPPPRVRELGQASPSLKKLRQAACADPGTGHHQEREWCAQKRPEQLACLAIVETRIILRLRKENAPGLGEDLQLPFAVSHWFRRWEFIGEFPLGSVQSRSIL